MLKRRNRLCQTLNTFNTGASQLLIFEKKVQPILGLTACERLNLVQRVQRVFVVAIMIKKHS